MKKWTKRLSISGALLFAALILLFSISIILLRGTPEWYRLTSLTQEQRAAAAQRATNKLAVMQNRAAQVRADERAATTRNRDNPTTSGTQPANAISISFTDEEINALIEDWSQLPDVRQVYERFMSDPRVVIQDGRMILAGKVKDLNAVTSLHFEPKITDDGKLSLKLVRILAGKLPLPEAILSGYEEKLTNSITQRQPAWRQQANIDRTGLANSAAISAELSDLLLNVLHDEPADPILFLRQSPINSASIPVRLSDLSIEDHTLNLTLLPMTPDERADLLKKIRDGKSPQEANRL